jgi:PAT family beta-lactamase induction signal transducer AmpG
MLPMFFSHALTNYWFCVAFSLPSFIVYYVYATVIAEQFGYGFGFAYDVSNLYAEGESKTSHYALATGFMALGMMLPGMVSLFKNT